MDKISRLLSELETKSKGTALYEDVSYLKKQCSKFQKRFEKIISQSDAQQRDLLKLQEKLERTNEKIKLLLDNANEGFLHIDSELTVQPEYSKTVRDIFLRDITGEKFYTLLYPDDNEKALFYKETLQDILSSDGLRSEVLISLLQKEYVINGRVINVEYKKLTDSFMIILSDITEKKRLEENAKKESEKLKMIVEVISSIEQFLEIKLSFELFAREFEEYKTPQKLQHMRAKAHTLKGLFAQKHFLNVTAKLHELETYIDKSIKEGSLAEELLNLTPEEVREWIEEDIQILKNTLGEDIFKKYNQKCVDKQRLKKLFYKSLKVMPQEYLRDLKELQYFSVEEFVKPYAVLVSDLAERMDKQAELKIESEIKYLPDFYKSFLSSLVHVFRNSVDHGIENEMERIEKGKPPVGLVDLKIYLKNGDIVIEVKDDGRGVSYKRADEEIKNMIFEEGFSTKDEIGTVSGRGVGLYALKKECENFGGNIEVENSKDRGLLLRFVLPFIEDNMSEMVLDLTGECGIRYFTSYCGYITQKDSFYKHIKNGDEAVYIDVDGDIKRRIFFCCDEPSAFYIAKKFIHSDSDEFISEHIGDVMKETANIIAGHLIKEAESYGININISPPGKGKLSGEDVFVKELVFDEFKINIGVKGI